MEEAKRQIRLRLIDPIKDRVRAQRYGIKPGCGILLYGPPGTGKTLLAKAVAGELDLPFFSITAADIFGKLVGDSEKNVRKLFREVRKHPLSVVFIDELETIFPNRSVDVHETTRKVVAYMLQELDGIDTGKNPILLLGATNVPWMVDEAFLRPGRFDVKLFVGLPDSDARKSIVDRLFSQGSVRPVPGLAEYISKRTENFSGADLKGIVDGIRQLAYERRLPLYTHALADEVLEKAAPSPAESIMDAIRKWEARI
jgi:SpoVK/Ycf46/Vps4 family AAA+-type ATPase